MFERFTTNSRRVVVLAQEEARRLAHDYIGTEHELLGLLGVDDPVVKAAVGGLVTRDTARVAVEEIIGRGEGVPTGHIPFTPRAKKVLELSLREALRLRHRSIQPGHIFLGVLREGEGVGAQVLAQAGLDFEKASARVVADLKAEPEREVPLGAQTTEAFLEAVLAQVPAAVRPLVDERLADPPAAVTARAAALAEALDPTAAAPTPFHLLAVLLGPGDGSVADEVAAHGVAPAVLRAQLLAALA